MLSIAQKHQKLKKEPRLHAWFSQKAKEYYGGKSLIYFDENNNEIEVTIVGNKGLESFYGWKDVKYVGIVTRLSK